MPLNVESPILTGAPAAVASYDYTDIAAGTGIETFYCGQTSGAYMLSTTPFYSDATLSSHLLVGASYAYTLEASFATILNLPKIIKGDTIVNVPIGVQSTDTGKSFLDHVRVTLQKVTDDTPTDIATGLSSKHSFSSLNAGDYGYSMACARLVCPRTHLKAGDYLRVYVELYTQNENTGNHYHFIGHDPKNRATSASNPVGHAAALLTFGTDPSLLTAQIPFKIDLS